MKRGQRVLALVLLAMFVLVPLSGVGLASTLQTKASGISVPVQCVFVDPANGWVYAGTYLGAGVYRSTDNGETWQEYGTGLPRIGGDEPQPDVLAIVKRGTDILAGTWGEGVYQIAASGGTSWSKMGGIPDNYDYIRSMAVGSDYTYAAESRGRVWRLPSGSSTWDERDSLPSGQSNKFLFVDASDNLYAGVTGLGVYKYVGSWQGMGNLGSRDALAMDYGPDGNLWVGTSDGVHGWSGTAWAAVSGTSGWDVRALKRNPLHPSELFVGLSTGAVYRYRQSTANWDQVSGLGIPSGQPVWSLAFGTGEPQRLFVGTDDGLYYTDIVHLILSLDNDPDASVSLSAGDLITYTMGYDNSGDTTLSNVVLKCDIPASGVVGWDPENSVETDETTHEWSVGDVGAGESGQDDFWVAVGPVPTIPAPPRGMLVVNEGTYGTVSGTPVPSSDPVYNWINPSRIYLPLVMKGHG